MEIIRAIAVILAVFLHRGNGRAFTPTSNDNIEKVLGLVEKELNTALNETNQKPTEREENPADLLRLVEPDFLSQGALKSFSDDVSGESVIHPTEATFLWRHKRSVGCYTGKVNSITLASGTVISSPICLPYPSSYSAACSRSKSSQNNNERKCKTNYKAFLIKGESTPRLIPTSCSCA